MVKRVLALGIVSGVLAGIISLVFAKIYASSLGVDFSRIATSAAMILFSLLGTVSAALGYLSLVRVLKQRAEILFNLLFVTLSFATIPFVFGAKLPLDLQSPELFPGMVIPMHFFPALGWLTLKPLFLPQKR